MQSTLVTIKYTPENSYFSLFIKVPFFLLTTESKLFIKEKTSEKAVLKSTLFIRHYI